MSAYKISNNNNRRLLFMINIGLFKGQLQLVGTAIYVYYLQQEMKEEDKQVSSQNIASYQDQNKMLRQLYEQRMKARRVNSVQAVVDEPQELILKPEIKNFSTSLPKQHAEPQLERSDLRSNNLFLNTLYYDSRQQRPNCFIKFASLFNQDAKIQNKIISPNVQSIFISTFGFQTEVFQKILFQSNAKLVVLNDSNQVGVNKVIKQYGKIKNFTVVLQAKKQSQRYGVFHTKLWLIKFKDFLRVVVCTSNQHVMDWAVWQNAYWYQDFKLKANTSQINHKSDNQSKTNQFKFNKDFQQTLGNVLDAMLPKKQLQELTSIKIQDYLFQDIKVILIPSIPGRYNGQQMKKQGMCKLQQIMKKFNKLVNPTLTYNSTSLGVFDSQFISELYVSFCPSKQLFQMDRFRLVYPTKRYIQQQTGGQASVLFLSAQNLNKSSVSKKIFHKFDTNPQNPILGLIPHLKTVFIQSSSEPNSKGILYVGSHNMTKAAWGKLQKKETQLYIANSQLGIIMLDVNVDWYKKWCPFKYPPQPYGEKDEPFLRDFLC